MWEFKVGMGRGVEWGEAKNVGRERMGEGKDRAGGRGRIGGGKD